MNCANDSNPLNIICVDGEQYAENKIVAGVHEGIQSMFLMIFVNFCLLLYSFEYLCYLLGLYLQV